MKKVIPRYSFLSLLTWGALALPLALVLYTCAGKPIGKVVAYTDLARNSLRIKAIGLPFAGFDHYVRLLKSRYNVEVDRVADCVVSHWNVGYSSGYNNVAEPAIYKRFVKDIFRECYRDALKEFIATHELSKESKESLESELRDL